MHKSKTRPLTLLLVPSVLCLFISVGVNAQQGPDLFSYRELVQLYEQETPPTALQNQLHRLLTTPFVSNSATARGVKPLVPRTPKLGEFLRIVEWNIERGLEYDAIRSAFTDPARFAKLIDSTEYPRGSSQPKLILQQIALMKRADVIVLNEVDWGLKRTDYRNVARELATAMQMNYVYGVEFVEVDPLTLGTETLEGETSANKAEMVQHLAVDKSRTLGLHGTAILSRFPLRNTRIVRFVVQGHDWYHDE